MLSRRACDVRGMGIPYLWRTPSKWESPLYRIVSLSDARQCSPLWLELYHALIDLERLMRTQAPISANRGILLYLTMRTPWGIKINQYFVELLHSLIKILLIQDKHSIVKFPLLRSPQMSILSYAGHPNQKEE